MRGPLFRAWIVAGPVPGTLAFRGRCPGQAGPARGRERRDMNGYTGIFGLIVLALDIWAIVSVVGSSASTGSKVIWVLVILFLPILGFLAWLLFGPRGSARRI